MARRRRSSRGTGPFSTGHGAAQVMRSHLAKQGKKGNRKPSTKSNRSQASAASQVGGYAGANFDNASVGR